MTDINVINVPLSIKDASQKELVRVEESADGKNVYILLGGPGGVLPTPNGILFLFPPTSADRLNTSARIRLNADYAGIAAGGNGKGGSLTLIPSAVTGTGILDPNKATLFLDGEAGNIHLGGNGQSGDIHLYNPQREPIINIAATNGQINLGGSGTGGNMFLFSTADLERSSTSATMRLNGTTGDILLGGKDAGGGLYLFPPNPTEKSSASANVILSGETADMVMGGNDQSGDIYLKNINKEDVINLKASTGQILLGGPKMGGNLYIFPSSAQDRASTSATIRLDGNAGDITLRGADCAEYFAVSEQQSISPGMVLIAESDELLSPSQTAYDKRVVGVVSGAGSYKPGILLGKDLMDKGLPIALSGKVYCNVDASNGAISVGDLLTTSSIPGHAMKADDPHKSFGAIIGKALKPMTEGKGLIPILVALQ